MHIHLCGVRGSTPAPGAEFVRYGGHTSCVAVTARGQDLPTLVLDAGTGIRSVTSMLAGAPFRGTVLVSHVHWDHVQGLPFFAAGDRAGASVRLVLPAQGGKSGRDLIALLDLPEVAAAEDCLHHEQPVHRRFQTEARDVNPVTVAVAGCFFAIDFEQSQIGPLPLPEHIEILF